jgi:hypothetical protein
VGSAPSSMGTPAPRQGAGDGPPRASRAAARQRHRGPRPRTTPRRDGARRARSTHSPSRRLYGSARGGEAQQVDRLVRGDAIEHQDALGVDDGHLRRERRRGQAMPPPPPASSSPSSLSRHGGVG